MKIKEYIKIIIIIIALNEKKVDRLIKNKGVIKLSKAVHQEILYS